MTASKAVESSDSAEPEADAFPDGADALPDGADPTDSSSDSDVTAAPRRFPTVWVALAVAVGLLLGYLAGLLTPSLRAPGDTSAEAGFARDMSVHHAQVIEMSMMIYSKTTDSDIRTLAYDIVTNQGGQIGIMSRWLGEWRLSPNSSRPRMAWMPDGQRALENGLMPGLATTDQMAALDRATGKDADVLYCQLVLRHHLGGIHMVDGILELSDRPEVVQLATTMKNGQQREVTILTDKLRDLGARPL